MKSIDPQLRNTFFREFTKCSHSLGFFEQLGPSLDQWIDQKFLVIDQGVPDQICQEVFDRAQQVYSQNLMKPALIGRAQSREIFSEIRSDQIFWLEKNDPELLLWNRFRDELQNFLNQELFLGLRDFEGHLAHYGSGQKYEAHIDQSPQKSPLHGERVVTWLLYLNPSWQPGDGGELCIHRDSQNILIEPLWGRCLLFQSQEILHSVIASNKSRWSLTGWFRRS